MEKEKFARVFASVLEEIEEERQIVGTAGRRLLSDLCFYLSFEVISFYLIFHIIIMFSPKNRSRFVFQVRKRQKEVLLPGS